MALPELEIRKLGDHAVLDHTSLNAAEIFEIRQGGVHLGWVAAHAHMRIRHGEKPGELVVEFLPWQLEPGYPGGRRNRELDDPRNPRYEETLDVLEVQYRAEPKGGEKTHFYPEGDPFSDEPYNQLKHWEHKSAVVEDKGE